MERWKDFRRRITTLLPGKPFSGHTDNPLILSTPPDTYPVHRLTLSLPVSAGFSSGFNSLSLEGW